MTFTIDITDEELRALAAKAQAQGLSAEQYARLVLEQDLKGGLASQIDQGFEPIAITGESLSSTVLRERR